MYSNVNDLGTLHRERFRALILPREHGAWGMMLVPLLTGASVGLLAGGRPLPLLPLTVAAVAIFWMRTPVESLLGTSPLRAQSDAERSTVMRASFLLAMVTAVSLAGLFWGGQNTYLLLLGAISGLAFGVQAILKKLSRKTRMAAQVIGAMGLTCTAPAAYYVAAGEFSNTAWLLWLANWLFASEQIHFVQLRIHAARVERLSEKLLRGRRFLLGQGGLVVVLLLAWRFGELPGLALLAFVPTLFRGVAWFLKKSEPLVVRRLGWSELANALAFGVLLVASFHFGR
jgi:hypothetical protein